jgi:hypothetical protein
MFEHLGMDFAQVAATEARSTATTSLPARTDAVTLYGPADEDVMTIQSIDRAGDDLVIQGKAYGTMPLTVKLRPEQARGLMKLVRFSWISYLFAFLFRRTER